MKKKAQSIGVPLKQAEQVRRYLRERHLLRDELKIQKDDARIYLPVKKIPEELAKYDVFMKSFEVKVRKTRCYKDVLTLPKKHMQQLPTSYDIIGEIILIKLPKSLFRYKGQIGQALLQTHTNIRTVCLIDPISGEFRTRKSKIIAGENEPLTTHTEYGLTYTVNIHTTYFSPRLATERQRVARLVRPGETVVDMFAGVAPFSIMIARFGKPKIVYAIDKNKEATRLAEENVKKNHVLQTVQVINADAKEVRRVIPRKADRIIMNLPFSAFKFLPEALSISATTSTLHYYDILPEEKIEGRISALKKIAVKQDYTFTDVSVHKIKSYAPREFYIGLDITATKTPT